MSIALEPPSRGVIVEFDEAELLEPCLEYFLDSTEPLELPLFSCTGGDTDLIISCLISRGGESLL
jgi:hypothetical protein